MYGVYDLYRNDESVYINLQGVRTVRGQTEGERHWVEISYADKSERMFFCDTREEAERHASGMAEEIAMMNNVPVYHFPVEPRKVLDTSTQGKWEAK